jgi:hypothetical protein
MKIARLTPVMVLFAMVLSQCSKEPLDQQNQLAVSGSNLKSMPNLPQAVSHATFTVKVENVSVPYSYFDAGTQLIPDGGSSPAPAFPGGSFTLSFHAGKNHRLSFATMYGASNDWFFAPDDEGIALFSGSTPLTGDITSLISRWDAGTEVDGSTTDESESVPVTKLSPADSYIKAMLDYDGSSLFTLTISVLPGSPTPVSPVAWVVHSAGQKPIFSEGSPDYGKGLEDLAEMGNPGPLGSYLAMNSGYVSPVAPFVWAIHKQGQKPIFKEGKLQYGNGLETLAETGDPSLVYESLEAEGYQTGVQAVPDGGSGAGPIFPGESFTFSFEANVGDYLSFASMLGASNDEFFAPSDMGIRLFNGSMPIAGEITGLVYLWDAGTEVNEYPGAGINEGPGTDIQESQPVMKLNDPFHWPSVPQVVRITISAE